jgi:hypothetical protein
MELPVRAAIFAVELFDSACINEMMAAPRSIPRLLGEPVTVSYVADPCVSYGRFCLENQGDATVTATVQSSWLEFEKDRLPLTMITVFDVGQDRMVDPSEFRVGAAATMVFLVGFPRTPHEPQSGEHAAVGLRLSVDGSELEALSPIEFVRRFPRIL